MIKFLALVLLAVFAKSFASPANQDHASNNVMMGTSTTIMFTKNWHEVVQDVLRPLRVVHLVYARERLATGNGSIFAQMKYKNDGKVYTVELKAGDKRNMVEAFINVPRYESHFMMVWFKRGDEDTGDTYDSHFGKNYKFLFNQIIFTRDFHEFVEGHLVKGGQFDVLYNHKRIPYEDNGYLGMSGAWSIFAFVKFSEHGEIFKQIMSRPVGGSPILNARFTIPHDADKVIMWFWYSGYVHTSVYESNYGENYHFKL